MATASTQPQETGQSEKKAADDAPVPPADSQVIHRTTTIKRPPSTYLRLNLLSSDPNSKTPPIDILTARAYLTSALEQFLGITGAAIPVDFLKVEGRDVWIRVPREDASKVVGALSQWVGKDSGVGWRIRDRGEWLGSLSAGDGRQLFHD